jgi:alkanesulfonate monooxygenase SsuD/methylene tetrahydromethanopterin reductase-like flavin-dependent oxidoreductase (luciferase family)
MSPHGATPTSIRKTCSASSSIAILSARPKRRNSTPSFADNVGLLGGSIEANSYAAPVYWWEPLTLLSALATIPAHIGLIATVSTSYLAPYHVARKFAALDQLSGGRAGWNVVTSGTDAEAANFGLPTNLPHGERYARAAEYRRGQGSVDSWADDAFGRQGQRPVLRSRQGASDRP